MMDIDNLRNCLKKDFLQGKIPFAIDKEDYKRFSQEYTVFSRVAFDENFLMFHRGINEKAIQRVGTKGYSRIGYAAQTASWTIYDHFHGAFDWTGVEKSSTPSPTQLVSSLPKMKNIDRKINTKAIKRVAQIFGACGVGITEIDPEFIFIYSHDSQGTPIQLPEGVNRAIVMLIEMDYEAIGSSPTLPASITTGNGYSRMAFLIACMAQFLRDLGYKAIPSGNDTALSVPLAVQAGLGQFGRNGLLITPKFGQRVRICKVFTDFPLDLDSPINMGVTNFCRVCKKCAKFCPSQSIPYDRNPTWESPWKIPSNNSGGTYKWYVNAESCYEYWVKNTSDCSNCIRVCPFTKPSGLAHDLARFIIKNFQFLDPVMVLMDDLMSKFPMWRYGKKKNPENFWNSKMYLGKKMS